MHSSTAVLHSQPFSLGYPPSSSSSDCIGSQQQRYFSPSAAFNTGDEENNSRRIGPIGHSLSDPSAISTSTNGLSYSPRGSGVQDVQFAPSPGGLLISPTDGTPADSIVSNPTSLYAQQASPWSRGMPGFVSPGGRIPTLHPAVNQPNSLQGSGSSLSGNPIMARDTYPGGYALSRNAFPSPSATLNDYPRYPYSSSMPQAVGNQLDAYSSYVPTHRASQPVLDAPPFRDTENINHIMGSNNQKVTPVIQAKIHKGFFQADDKWTCYRRNYFSVSCSFTLQPLLNGGTYYFQTQGQRMEPIVNWAMSISAVVNESDNETRELVQHTPKRDKQSERKPEKVCLRPHQPYYLASNMTGSSPHSPMFGVTQQMDFPGYGVSAQPPQQHTFERIQFQKATANNGKRRAQQQFYNLVVELHALVSRQDGQHWEKVARRISDPMVVRGRSPGHYKDERRHSSASMGDSGGRGSSGDTGRGMLPSSIDHQQYSSQMQYLYDSSQRGDSHYNHCRDMPRHSYSQFGQTNHSAEAISPLVSTSDGSLEFIFPDTLGGHESTDVISHGSRYHHSHHHHEDDSSFRRDSGSSGSSSTQSHVPSLDLSSNSGTLDDTFDPMIAEYHSDEQDDGSEHYSKHANAERCPLASIVNDSSSQCSRNGSAGGTSFSRFIDPVQESLCA